jgi:predicted homoserine dehydrogenase-like protein
MRLFHDDRMVRVGLSGSGYISSGLLAVLARYDDVTVTSVFTGRHPSRDHSYLRPDLLTRNVTELIDGSDLVVECSGGVTRAMTVVGAAFAAGIPVVTVNAEFQVTVGHLFTQRGLITEAEGDQPGALAALAEEIRLMGFEPLVYGNVKTFLDLNPSRENMAHQARLHGISPQQVTSFTDGTKLHVEQALVANGLGASIARTGMLGVREPRFADYVTALTDAAVAHGGAISDYCMPSNTDVHVFIVATHPDPVGGALRHYKLGPGPHYLFSRNRHLGHFEVPRTIKRVIETGRPLINNGTTPWINVVAIAKTSVPAGTRIDSAIGSVTFRGVAVTAAEHPDLPPIGMMENATLTRDIAAGQHLTSDDVELSEPLSRQLAAYATA